MENSSNHYYYYLTVKISIFNFKEKESLKRNHETKTKDASTHEKKTSLTVSLNKSFHCSSN